LAVEEKTIGTPRITETISLGIKGLVWFKVGINTPIDQSIEFNWWIIN